MWGEAVSDYIFFCFITMKQMNNGSFILLKCEIFSVVGRRGYKIVFFT